MDFYNDLITQKSWITLQSLKKNIDFTLIGGWAVYLYTKGLKSKDIDIIIDYDTLSQIRKLFPVTKNERLTKYEARIEEVQIDIYLPFYSDLGIGPEEILKSTKSIDTIRLPKVEILLILKQYTYHQRKLSVKGQKDKLDLLSLIAKVDIDYGQYISYLRKFGKEELLNDLKDIIKSTTKIPEINLNEHSWSKIKEQVLKLL